MQNWNVVWVGRIFMFLECRSACNKILEEEFFMRSFLATHEIPTFCGTRTFFLFLHLPETLKQMNLVHILKSCLFKIHFNIALVSIPRSSNALFPSGFPPKILYAIPLASMPASRTYLTLLYSIVLIFGEKYKSWIFSSRLLLLPS